MQKQGTKRRNKTGLRKTRTHGLETLKSVLSELANFWEHWNGYGTLWTGAHPFLGEERAEYERLFAERNKRTAMERLAKQKYAKEQRVGDRLIYRLTEDGWRRALRDRIQNCTEILPGNGLCYVMFDIPENQRALRNMLRNFLKSAGFEKLQQSVWITRRNVMRDLHELLTIEKTGAWTRVTVQTA